MKFVKLFLLALVGIFVVFVFFVFLQFRAPGGATAQEQFVIGQQGVLEEEIIDKLASQGFITNKALFNLILDFKGWHGKMRPGGYLLSRELNAYEVAKILTGEPYRKWVVVPPGKRKEQVGLILKRAMDWPDTKMIDFIKNAPEGYLFPDTYLIAPGAEAKIAIRIMQTNFNENFSAELQKKLLDQNIRNDTAIKMASLIERESGGAEDKPIIAGIIWNRLNKGMRLEIDATVQYALAGELCGMSEKLNLDDCNFWPRLGAGVVRTVDSLYNTYLVKGLPPGPIASPSLASIEAVANSAETEALYYLHSPDKVIHTAKTFEEHRENIKQYLNLL